MNVRQANGMIASLGCGDRMPVPPLYRLVSETQHRMMAGFNEVGEGGHLGSLSQTVRGYLNGHIVKEALTL